MTTATQEHLVTTLTIKIVSGDTDVDEVEVCGPVTDIINEFRGRLAEIHPRLAVFESGCALASCNCRG